MHTRQLQGSRGDAVTLPGSVPCSWAPAFAGATKWVERRQRYPSAVIASAALRRRCGWPREPRATGRAGRLAARGQVLPVDLGAVGAMEIDARQVEAILGAFAAARVDWDVAELFEHRATRRREGEREAERGGAQAPQGGSRGDGRPGRTKGVAGYWQGLP